MLLSFPIQAQDTLRIKDVFDFDIGDVFNYKTYYHGGCDGSINEWDTLVDKAYSFNMDTVYYKFQVTKVIVQSAWDLCVPGTFPSRETREDKYYNMDSCLWKYDHSMYFNSIVSDTDGCGTKLAGYTDRELTLVNGRTYGKGVGLVKDINEAHDMTQYLNDKYLIYYHKKNLICGNGIILDVSKLNLTRQKINIYPNPTRNSFYLKFESLISGYSIKIVDLTGRIVFQEKNIRSEIYEYNSFNMTPGIYNLIIQSNEGNTIHKTIVKSSW